MKYFAIQLIIALLIFQSSQSQNYGLNFTSTTQRVTIDFLDNTPTSGITYEGWCKLNSYYTGQGSEFSGSFLFVRQDAPASYGVFGTDLLVLSPNVTPNGGGIGFGMNFTGFPHQGLHGNTVVTLNEWHHIAGVWSGDSMIVYLDGLWDGSINVSTLGHFFDPPNKCYLGYREFYYQSGFDGMLDDVRIWSYAKTQAEIKADMYKELTGNETGLLAYWDLNEGIGQTVNDKTGNGQNGYLGNNDTTNLNDPAWASSTAPVPYHYTVANGDWNTNTTWAFQNAPTSPWAIVDIKNTITAATSITVNKLTITPGASLTVNSGNNLTINGTGDLVVQADATGMGSLIEYNSGVNATVQLYLTANSWHYLTPAVSNSFSGAFTGSYLRTFDENTYSWNPYITGLSVGLSPMTGYACWVPTTAVTTNLNGALSVGLQSMTVTRNNSLLNPGWNLVGNPYPSSLDWDATSGWDKTNVDNTVYFYSGVDNQYHYYVGSGGTVPSAGVNDGTNQIPPMQGFFVKATATGTFSVNDAARIHSTQGFYKNSSALTSVVPMIRLQISGNNDQDETVVRFVENATEAQDGQFDAWKLFSDSHPQIYSTTVIGEDLAVNSLPELLTNKTVPLGFFVPEPATYSLAVTEWVDMPYDFKVFLEDQSTGEIQEMNNNSGHLFSATPMDDPNRFLLHFQNSSSASDSKFSSDIQIYAWNETIFVNDLNKESGQIIVSDLQGREVKRIAANANGTNQIQLNHDQHGYFLVQYVKSTGFASAKVFIP